MSAPTGRVLLLAHSHVFGPFRVGSHHLARALTRRGFDVVHLSTPVSTAHRLTGRVDHATLRALPSGPVRIDGVLHHVPRTVLPRPFGPFRVRDELTRRGIDTAFDAVLLDQPLLWDDSIRSLAPRLVYRPTDLYPDGRKAELQRAVLAQADAVVATSDEVRRRLGDTGLPTLVLPNGVDIARFTAAADDAPRPDVCVYVGALDGRFDWARLTAWAAALPAVRFRVAGPDPSPSAPLPANVELLGAVPYDQLPSLLHGARVGLLPLSEDPLNAGRSPMKRYEYLAAGLAVVSRETPELRPDPAAGLFTYRGDTDGETALRAALAHPSPNAAGSARARTESWDAKAEELLAFLDLPVAD